MKISRLNFLILSLSAVSVCFPYSAANAGLRVNNSSLMKNQMQVNIERTTAQNTPQPARTITNDDGSSVTVSGADMEACSMIYPSGAFDWVKPTTGTRRGAAATCAALVELRSYQNSAGTSYTVLARSYLAAGDAMKCNIDEFSDITLQGRDFVYPADNAPTIEDVEKVMAQENKSNAGFKILAATLVGGLGGNLLGQNDAGKDSALGLDKDKLKMAAIGAAGGAALMTASTQANNYKASSVILSTGVNATAGAVAGNLMASGDDVIKIAPCKAGGTTYKHCIYGSYEKDSEDNKEYTWDEPSYKQTQAYMFLHLKDGRTMKCSLVEGNTDQYEHCMTILLTDVEVKGAECTNHVDKDCLDSMKGETAIYKYAFEQDRKDSKQILAKKQGSASCDDCYVPIKTAKESSNRVGIMIPLKDSFNNKLFGYSRADWRDKKTRESILGNADLNNVYDVYGNKQKVDEDTLGSSKFSPSMQSADDGDAVDLSNKARAKSTLIGAGGGAALGAISGAAGANSEIQQRYVTALREYEDSLGNISCSTGNRYLSKYNDVVIIPEMKTNE